MLPDWIDLCCPACRRKVIDEVCAKPVYAELPAALQRVADAVAGYYGLPVASLLGHRRHPSISFPRMVCYYLAQRYTGMGCTKLARQFHRNHATILHAWKTVAARRDSDRETLLRIAAIEEIINTTSKPANGAANGVTP